MNILKYKNVKKLTKMYLNGFDNYEDYYRIVCATFLYVLFHQIINIDIP